MLPPACASGAARLSAFHHGSGLGDGTPPLSFSTALPGMGPVSGRYPQTGPSQYSEAPRRPVVVPVGRRPEAARERVVNPRAGAVPTPSCGIPFRKASLTGGLDVCNWNRDRCQELVSKFETDEKLSNLRIEQRFSNVNNCLSHIAFRFNDIHSRLGTRVSLIYQALSLW